MARLSEQVKRAEKGLLQLEEGREEVLALCRGIERAASKGIVAVHNREGFDMRGLGEDVRKLTSFSTSAPRLFHQGYVTQAMQEYAELRIFESLARGKGFPTLEDVGVEPDAYLLGIADAVGELRRWCLSLLIEGKLKEAEAAFAAMQEAADELACVHHAHALVPIRQKKDAVRAIVERTHGELLMAKLSQKKGK